jgi:hypothetical protein
VVETFLEAMLLSFFSSFVAFFIMPVISQKRLLFIADFGLWNSYKSAGHRSGEYGDAPVLSLSYFLRNP